jgi:mono/diheme cytochrome c family protein
MKAKYLLIGALMLLLLVLLAACSSAQPAATPCPDCPTCPEAPACPDCPACPAPPEPVVAEVPYQDEWANSPHNKADAEAFNHWNEESPAEVPTNCANCHTSAGYQEYVATGAVAAPIPAPAGTIQCVTCHNEATATLTSVKFPQKEVPAEGGDPVNVVLTGLGPEARCMVCHQGRASTSTVDASIARFGEDVDPDAVPAPVKDDQGNDVTLGFTNIHYFPAAATLYGTEVKGGYQYAGKAYDGKFRHTEGIDTCIGCHDQHTLEIQIEKCTECHEGVTSAEDLRNVRMQGSLADYDGDGDVTEGIASELAGVQEKLYAGIQEYAKSVAGAAIVYNPAAYPYFFADANENGTADEGEEGYINWTPRLLKAAYNYQMSVKDPGAFAHNAKYMIQLTYDSIADLNENLGTIDMTAMNRQDPGHFAGNTEPFRHWDAEGEVPGGCVKCHQADGIPQFLENGANIAMPPSNGFMCTTCHNGAEWPARYVVESVTFPSGAEVSFGGKDADGNFVADESNLCIECHQGRSSTPSVNKALAGKDPETPDPTIRFTNIHYFAAGATIFGNEVQGAYQYEGKEYVGQNVKHPLNKCKDCHDVHALEVKLEACATCHSGAKDPNDPKTYRMDTTDYDGDGDVAEGISAEIDAFAEQLYAGIQAYAKDKGTPILYDAAAYPYFFVDADENGEADVNDKGAAIGYNAWTPTLLTAAYNYQYYQKDPGAFTHNPKYVLQFLYDSIDAVGGDTTGLTRPAVPAE